MPSSSDNRTAAPSALAGNRVTPATTTYRKDVETGGVTHQLVPCPRASSGDLLADTAAAARECTTALEVLIELMEGGVDPIEAVTLLRLYRPLSERLLGVVAQLEAIARRDS